MAAGLWTLLIHLFFLPINADVPAIMDYLDQKLLNVFEECPRFYPAFGNDLCNHKLLSCATKGYPNKCGGFTGLCSCHYTCLWRNDCCLDFKTLCVEESEKTNTTNAILKGYNSTCERNHIIYEGPGGNYERKENEISVTDFVVYDQISGLSFRTMAVYNYYMNDVLHKIVDTNGQTMYSNSTQNNVIKWGKKLLNYRENETFTVEEVRHFLIEDVIPEGMGVMNEPYSDAQMCNFPVPVNCYNYAGHEVTCKGERISIVRNITEHCAYVKELGYNQFVDDWSRPQSDITDVSCGIDVMRLWEGRRPLTLLQLVEITVLSDGTIIAESSTNPLPEFDRPVIDASWDAFELTEHPGTNNYEMSVDCSQGKLFIGTQCQKPQNMVILVDTNNYNKTIGQENSLQNVYDFVKQNFDIIKFNESTVRSTHLESKTMARLFLDVTVDYGDLESINAPYLPISGALTNHLKENVEIINSTQQMIVCFGSKTNASGTDNTFNNNNNALSCDYIIKESKLTLEHFDVNGLNDLLAKTKVTEERASTSNTIILRGDMVTVFVVILNYLSLAQI